VVCRGSAGRGFTHGSGRRYLLELAPRNLPAECPACPAESLGLLLSTPNGSRAVVAVATLDNHARS